MLERYLIPLAPYVLLALATIAGLFIFASFEREIQRLKSRLRQKDREFAGQEKLQIRLDDFDARLHDAEQRATLPVQPAAVKPSLNLDRKSVV